MNFIKTNYQKRYKSIFLKGSTRKGAILNFLRPLMTAGLPLMKNVLTQLAKNVLLPFGLSARVSAANLAI